MSNKITAKNLSYDTSLPPFLAALRAQAAGVSGPDPILAAQRRAAKKRSSSEEAEDNPLVVDEDGNVVDLEVDDDGVTQKKEPDSKAAVFGRKRKVGKVVGEAADQPAEIEVGSAKAKKINDKEGAKDRKPKKKAKKIKLSFDEDDG
ncbi:hypothetical protein G7046_g5824 [Stylonectria norvegica]|nr:hypothetical protein G7046_g5824 [Stylonectria norvegica]